MTNQEPEPIPDVISTEEIAMRAYEISLGDDAGTPDENWGRAERELSEALRMTMQ